MTDKQAYIAFCNENWVPLFHRPFWWNAVLEEWDVKKFNNASGETAFLPFASYKKMGFSFSRNPFLTPYSGLLYTGKVSAKSKKDFIATVQAFLKQFSISKYNCHPYFHKDIEIETSGITYLLNTQKEYESIHTAYSTNIKRQLKKASKSLNIQEDKDTHTFFDCYTDSMKKNKATELTPYELIQKIFTATKKEISTHIFTAYNEQQEAHASIWYVADEKYAYYLLGGSKQEYLGSGAMAFLIDHCIQQAVQGKKEYFDFEGSENQGVAKFFAKFGGEKTNYPILSAPTDPKLKALLKLKGLIGK